MVVGHVRSFTTLNTGQLTLLPPEGAWHRGRGKGGQL